jgi:hypothetical protein
MQIGYFPIENRHPNLLEPPIATRGRRKRRPSFIAWVAQRAEDFMRIKHKRCRDHVAAALAAAAALWMAGPGHASESSGVYALTVSNTNGGQNFSPPVIALHTQAYRLFELGQPATVELWRLAEDGSTTEFKALAHPELREMIVGRSVHRRQSPVFTTTFETPSELLLSVAAMLSLTNDGFIAARSVPLPIEVAVTTTVALHAFDAGSEANTELCAHVPCEVHDQRITEGAEGVVSEHAGIRGDADLPYSRGWSGPELGMLTITRLR